MSTQLKIALFGATGMIGSRIAAEAARRGHQVTALARNPARVPADVPNLKAAQADLLDAASVGAAVRGHDVAA
ncbi:MAG TPA: NAD(P)H-binding protein, partial [Paraburkholderia sp.]